MKLDWIRIGAFRSFVDSGSINFGQITVLVGPNNSGKSSILKAIGGIQHGIGFVAADIRAGSKQANIQYKFKESRGPLFRGGVVGVISASPQMDGGNFSSPIEGATPPGQQIRIQPLTNREPDYLFVPYFSKRKTVGFQEDVRSEYASTVQPNVSFLASRLSRLCNPTHPKHEQYFSACKNVLGFVVTTVPSPSGQLPGVYLPDESTITVEQMGEGVANIVFLLVELTYARGKIFLIEELENDLHPQALKAVLSLIRASSSDNQFVISTHSNIVLRELAGESTSIYSVSHKENTWPVISSIALVAPDPVARIEVLRQLGYSATDFDMWDAYLILEESSAERLIRDHLIPLFAPKLSRMRTMAAKGTSNVEPTVNDLMRVMLFTHLEPVYAGKTWVKVDGDDSGKDVAAKLKSSYKNWPEGRISCFDQDQFERYYPRVFRQEIDEALATSGRQEKRSAKNALLAKVLAWLDKDEARARNALDESAQEVIEFLRSIQSELKLA